jgi:hypothetical protein
VKHAALAIGALALVACVDTTLAVPAGHPAHAGGPSGRPVPRSTALSSEQAPPNEGAPAGEGAHQHHHHHHHAPASGATEPSAPPEHEGK